MKRLDNVKNNCFSIFCLRKCHDFIFKTKLRNKFNCFTESGPNYYFYGSDTKYHNLNK